MSSRKHTFAVANAHSFAFADGYGIVALVDTERIVVDDILGDGLVGDAFISRYEPAVDRLWRDTNIRISDVVAYLGAVDAPVDAGAVADTALVDAIAAVDAAVAAQAAALDPIAKCAQALAILADTVDEARAALAGSGLTQDERIRIADKALSLGRAEALAIVDAEDGGR